MTLFVGDVGYVSAAACTCLAFLSCHPLGARGDHCLVGPFRSKLLEVGAFGALLKAALSSSADDVCDPIIQQTAAVGIMYMSTMVRPEPSTYCSPQSHAILCST